jgi:hypothetical protein
LSDANIRRLELEVEAARAKLATDLSRLRSPAVYADFRKSLKQDAQEAKDLIVDQAKSTMQYTLQGMVDDLKAKAAANPAATLAIGAGIAWRVFRHPPIATALIGAGLFSLLRTSPARVSGNGTADYFSHAKERLKEQAADLAGEVRDQAAVIASDVKDHALAMAEAVKEQSAEVASAAKEQVQQWGADVEDAARDVPVKAASLAHKASRATQYDRATRDNLLLGTAGLAVVAALGVAYQRRNAEFDSR